jgi:hypothetical protein
VASPVAVEHPDATKTNVARDTPTSEKDAMVTVTLRGKQAERLRRLAKRQDVSLSKLLVWLMDSFERNQQ